MPSPASAEPVLTFETRKNRVLVFADRVQKTFKPTRHGMRHARRELAALRALDGLEGVPALLEVRSDPMTVVMTRVSGTPLSDCANVSEPTMLALQRLVERMLQRGIARHSLPARDVLVASDGSVGIVDFERSTRRFLAFAPGWLIAKTVTRYHLMRLVGQHAPQLLTPRERNRLRWQQALRDSLQRPAKLKRRVLRALFGTQWLPRAPAWELAEAVMRVDRKTLLASVFTASVVATAGAWTWSDPQLRTQFALLGQAFTLDAFAPEPDCARPDDLPTTLSAASNPALRLDQPFDARGRSYSRYGPRYLPPLEREDTRTYYDAVRLPDGTLALDIDVHDICTGYSVRVDLTKLGDGTLAAKVSGSWFSDIQIAGGDTDCSLQHLTGVVTIDSLDWTTGNTIAARMELAFDDGDSAKWTQLVFEMSAPIELPEGEH
jgi:predicted Ser/Thr protein kinase